MTYLIHKFSELDWFERINNKNLINWKVNASKGVPSQYGFCRYLRIFQIYGGLAKIEQY